MFFDLNVPVPQLLTPKIRKGKQPQRQRVSVDETTNVDLFSPIQIAEIEKRLDMLIHLGYTVIALNQIVEKRVDPKAHINSVHGLISHFQQKWANSPKRHVVLLKRLTIVLDEDSEKGFGLTNQNTLHFTPSYDLLALQPTTAATFSLAALSHSQPSPLTAHIISIPLSSNRIPFHLKHTLVRTAIRNGVVFEIPYSGALGLQQAGGEDAKRYWWACAREVIRVCKGKGFLATGGVSELAGLRAPKDVANLLTLLDVPQDVAHSSLTKEPKSLVLRAQTRATYRATLSEPKVVIPIDPSLSSSTAPTLPPLSQTGDIAVQESRKRSVADVGVHERSQSTTGVRGESGTRKKRKKDKQGN